MFTEQNPPWAAKFGVPNWLAHQPVSAWLWSRPVKNASFLGSVRRTSPSHVLARLNASSQEISLNWPFPRSPVLSRGFLSRAGEKCCMIPAAPLPQITPLFTG